MSLPTAFGTDVPRPDAPAPDLGWVPIFKLVVFVAAALLGWGALALPLVTFGLV